MRNKKNFCKSFSVLFYMQPRLKQEYKILAVLVVRLHVTYKILKYLQFFFISHVITA